MIIWLYVGNYPNTFTKVELLNLFSGFENVIVERMFLNGNKSYAFVTCEDFDQALSIVKNLNGTDVSGRRLVIRARDESLQEYVNVLLQEEEDNSKSERSLVDDTKVLHKRKVEKLNKHVSTPLKFKKASLDQKSRDKQLSESKYNHLKPNQNTPPEQMHRTSISKENQSHEEQFSESKFNSLKANQNTSHEPHWISVSNFPIGTSENSIHELFSDYNPTDVKIICNSPRKDKRLTEAYVCFCNEDIAFEVILNFDNTVYMGRTILVNDTADPDLLTELMSITRI